MSKLIFCNNFRTTLATGIGPSATSATLTTTAGLPTISGDEYFVLSFFDAATGLIAEIMHCTEVVGNVVTVVRAQEGTAALTWSAGSTVNQEWTAGQAATMVQQFELQAQAGNYAADTGVANAYVANFTPTLTSDVVGAPLRVLWAHTNTNTSTIDVGPGSQPLRAPDGSALVAGDVVAGQIGNIMWNGTFYILFYAQALTNRIGVTRLATDAETIAGTSTTIAVTPHGLAAVKAIIDAEIAAINGVLVGASMDWNTNTPPTGYFEENGATVSRTTYAALNAVAAAASYAAPYGPGDGTTTFTIPDKRGYFLRVWDDGAGIDPGRTFGSTQAPAFPAHSHNSGIAQNETSPNVYGTTTSGLPGAATTVVQKENASIVGQPITSTAGSGTDNHPINIAIMSIIKY